MTLFPILTFHAIDDRRSVISFSPAIFNRAMTKLHAAGYRTLPLLEAAALISRREALPERTFAITFDDGYRSVYDHAVPILRQFGMTATVFLTVGKRRLVDLASRLELNARPMLSWREIIEMQDSGITFGAHTLTHPDLAVLHSDKAEEEICQSKAIIEDMLGTPVRSFAYPFGSYSSSTVEIVRRCFDCACSANLGYISGQSDVFTLERLDAYYIHSDRFVDLMLTPIFSPYIEIRAQLRRFKQKAQARSRRSSPGDGPLLNPAD